MTNSPLEPDVTGLEDIDAGSIRDDLDREPEEKLNREQSPAETKDEDGR